MSTRRKAGLWSGLDRPILVIVIFLMTIGIVLAFAASPAAVERTSWIDDPFYYLYRQLFFVGAGLCILGFTSALSVTGVRRFAGLALVAALITLVLVLVLGADVKGATRWIRIGSFSLQPSEFLKPAFVVIAAWLFSEEDRGAPVPGRLVAFGFYGVSVVLLMLQPDFGQTVLISLVFGALLWAGGLSWLHSMVLGALALVGGGGAYVALPHVRDRILDFIGPGGERTQTETALDAMARGGVWGAGPGEGQVKHLLPEAHTDFVFSVAAEEYGLIASLAIIGLYALLFARAWMLGLRLNDPFAQLATSGLALLFALQALVNIGVNLDIAPPTGMTLPFISYGGSSMLALCFSAGLLLALTRRRPGAYAPRPRQGDLSA
ncbi:MAG: cell division protein FtsW [Oceanicaulis sp.]|uniref:FtsW/RodA/SpoVE family cell cycle protein n=1 Tax=unclassified Oceanicaulis TaxID=2632123 RepID=UPI000C6B2CA4|nr:MULTISPECIES: putative peptidoglycan glycosyltransferase FtsW [unclassified Oceanicaulis]MAB68032.1 cell division protein FtsW [Oceanicaulis sp.]MBC39758.1 cell division protein FtsW [Oceanicaulis sp.]MBG36067.1 cell division protein FtsW [Oceanicaulis sp.]HBU61471.1 cell division protein FtsW [Oceanicaulis sp.]